jgi:hypothetical protein
VPRNYHIFFGSIRSRKKKCRVAKKSSWRGWLANVKAYIDYKTAQERIKAHELSLIKNAVANKKKRSKKIVGYSIIDPKI